MPRILLLCLVVVSLSAYGSSSTGLTIVPRAGGASGAAAADDEPNNKRTTRTVAVGGSATGNIETSGDKDWFRVTLASATKYRFDLESEAVNGATALGDPRLVFRNLSATRLGFANRGGTGNNARLEYAVPTSGAGDYFLVAMGQRNSTGSYRLSVTAVVNRAPQPTGSISGPRLTERGAVWSVDVSGKFTDPDGDTLSYSAASLDSTIATASASGSTVTITPVAAGTTTVTVTATDPGGLNAAQQISVTVNSSNRAPLPKGNIEPQALTLGSASKELDVSEKFVDADGDTLSYTVESSDSAIATASASGNPVTITPVAVGSTTITVTAKDPSGLKAAQIFSVTISNNAPTAVSNIPPLTLTLGDEPEIMDVSGKFSDADGHTLTYTAESSDITIATASASGNPVTITPVAVGATTITVTAKDLGGLAATQEISVTVLPQPNRKPILVGSIAPQQLEVGKAAGAVEVSGKFSDPDGDTLSYEVESSNTAIVVASMLNSAVILTPVKGGTVTITVTAEDPDGLSAEQIFDASVSNRPPVQTGIIGNRRLLVGETATVIVSNEFRSKFRDPDGDTLTYTATALNPKLVTINVSGSTVSVTAAAVGATSVTVKATDPGGLSAALTFSVTIPNRAPTSEGIINAQELWVGDTKTIDVAGKFNDPDGHALTHTATSSNTRVATVDAPNSILTIEPLSVGAATITVTARDPFGETAIQKFLVTIPNRPPVPNGTIPSQNLTGTASLQINVESYFIDHDHHTLTYTPVSDNTTVATVRASGSTVIITPGVKGTATITVTAQDPFGSTATQSFSVTVSNRPPTRNNTIANQTLNGTAPLQINVDGYFRDPDLHTLSYTPVSFDTAVATVRVSGNAVIITPGVKGTATVTVTAQDPFGSTATQIFSVTVSNRPPVRNSTIGNRMLHGTAPLEINVADYFRDPDRQALAYTPVSSNTSIAAVRVSGSVVTITPGIQGTTTITVTARDPFNRTAAQSFSVTVPNRPPTAAGIINTQRLKVTSETHEQSRTDHCTRGRQQRYYIEFCEPLFISVTRTSFSASVDVEDKFTDPDGDTLTYTATISGGSFTSTQNVSVSGSTVSISRSYRFRGTVTVTARDPGGLTAKQTFEVRPPNRAPIPVGSIRNISPLYLADWPSTASVDVSGKFRDPDGDTLTYSARSSSDNIATARMSGNMVTIRSAAGSGNIGTPRTARITVTAIDPGGLKATQTFTVTVWWVIMCGRNPC